MLSSVSVRSSNDLIIIICIQSSLYPISAAQYLPYQFILSIYSEWGNSSEMMFFLSDKLTWSIKLLTSYRYETIGKKRKRSVGLQKKYEIWVVWAKLMKHSVQQKLPVENSCTISSMLLQGSCMKWKKINRRRLCLKPIFHISIALCRHYRITSVKMKQWWQIFDVIIFPRHNERLLENWLFCHD